MPNLSVIAKRQSDRIFVFPEFPTPDHALTKPASVKILLILNILLILYYWLTRCGPS